MQFDRTTPCCNLPTNTSSYPERATFSLIPSKLLFCRKLAYDSAVIGIDVDEDVEEDDDVDVDANDFIDAVDSVDDKEIGASFEESEKGDTEDVDGVVVAGVVVVDDEEVEGFRRG